DQPHRIPGAELGDYTGLPINDAARQKAATWDASILSMPEQMAKPHAPQYFMRGPGPNMRITKVTDPTTLELLAYTIEGVFGRDDRVIWMDQRPHPSRYAEHTWDGFSTGGIAGTTLTVRTTHMKAGVIQRNGVPASAHSTMTEHFVRHGDILTLVTIIDDPEFLEEPLIRSSQWVRGANVIPDQRFVFEIVDEVATRTRGAIPSYPLGTRPDTFAKKSGLPFEAVMGGKQTLYPEYEETLRRLMGVSRPSPATGGAQ
ncbi:MAG: hypothetical protein AB7L71_18765, partial [Vicinamibacterales bacterium]